MLRILLCICITINVAAQSTRCDSIFNLYKNQSRYLIWNDTLLDPGEAFCMGSKFGDRDVKAGNPVYHIYGYKAEKNSGVNCVLKELTIQVEDQPTDIKSAKVDAFVKGYNEEVNKFIKTKIGKDRYENVFVKNICQMDYKHYSDNVIYPWMKTIKLEDITYETDSTISMVLYSNQFFVTPNPFGIKTKITFQDKFNKNNKLVIDVNDNMPRVIRLTRKPRTKYYLLISVEVTGVGEPYNDCLCGDLNLKYYYNLPVNANSK